MQKRDSLEKGNREERAGLVVLFGFKHAGSAYVESWCGPSVYVLLDLGEGGLLGSLCK